MFCGERRSPCPDTRFGKLSVTESASHCSTRASSTWLSTRWSTTRVLVGKSFGFAPPPRRALVSAADRAVCVAKPKLLGVDYAAEAAPVLEEWRRLAREGGGKEKRLSKAKLKSLSTFETRAWTNPLTAGGTRSQGSLASCPGP